MSGEISLNLSMQINKDNFGYSNTPISYQEDMVTGKGPSPGAITASSAGTGTQISFTNLSTPARAVIKNFDDTNYVEVGIVVGGIFYALLEVQAGMFDIIRFGRSMTKTIIYVRANTANCEVSVEAFEA